MFKIKPLHRLQRDMSDFCSFKQTAVVSVIQILVDYTHTLTCSYQDATMFSMYT